MAFLAALNSEQLRNIREFVMSARLDISDIANEMSRIRSSSAVAISFFDEGKQKIAGSRGTALTEILDEQSVFRKYFDDSESLSILDLVAVDAFPPIEPNGHPAVRSYHAVQIRNNGDTVGCIEIFDSQISQLSPGERAALELGGKNVELLMKLHCSGDNSVNSQSFNKQSLLESALANIREGVLIQDASGRIIDYNAAAVELLGIEESALVQKNYLNPKWLAINADGSELKSLDHPSALAHRTGQPQFDKIVGIRRLGLSTRWLRVNAVPIFLKPIILKPVDLKPIIPKGDAPLAYTITSFSEITEFVQLEEKMKLSARLSALGEVSGNIAHEINNPLAVIQGKLEQLRASLESRGFGGQQDLDECDKISSMANRIAKIVRGLKTLSRGASKDEFTSTKFNFLLNQALEISKPRIIAEQIQLTRVDVLDAKISCSPEQITQIIANLIENAIDAISVLDVKWIRLETEHENEFLSLRVIDSGFGIAPEVVERMMMSYFTTKALTKGTGLGLSISKSIAERHGGTLEYVKHGEHTSFVLRLPSVAIAAAKV